MANLPVVYTPRVTDKRLPIPSPLALPPLDDWAIYDPSGEHTAIIMPTGGGKARAVLMRMLLDGCRWPMIVIDPKGELYETCGGWLSRFADVGYLDPTDPNGLRWNPFWEIKPGHRCVSDVQNAVKAMQDYDANRDDRDHFKQQGYRCAVSCWLHVLHAWPDKLKNPAGLKRAISRGDRTMAEIFRTQSHPTAVEFAQMLLTDKEARGDGGDEEADPSKYRQSVYGVTAGAMELFDDPVACEVTSRSDFRISDLMCSERPFCLFIRIPPSHSNRVLQLVRMMLGMVEQEFLYRERTDRDGRPKLSRALMIIDEGASFGWVGLPYFLTQARGFGITVIFAATSFYDTEKRFGETILNACRTRILGMPYGDKEMERLEKMIGVVPVREMSSSTSKSALGMPKGKTEGSSIHTESLLPMVDIAATKPREKLVILGHGQPQLCRYTPVDDDADLRERLDLPLPPIRSASGHLLFRPDVPAPRNPWEGVEIDCSPPPRPTLTEEDEKRLLDELMAEARKRRENREGGNGKKPSRAPAGKDGNGKIRPPKKLNRRERREYPDRVSLDG